MNGKLKIAEFILLVLLLCVHNGCKRQTSRQEISPSNANAPVSSPAPSASPENKASAYGWTLQDNQRARLSDYLGKVVVLDFYATWCDPCRDETPHLVQMQSQYEPQGFQIVGLNVGGDDDREEVPGFAKEFKIQYPLGFPDDELADMYLKDNQNIPQTFVFDRTGKLVKRFIGYDQQEGRQLERIVQQTLGNTTQ
jgi:thiol-disulfide isomerase/thioredoxin